MNCYIFSARTLPLVFPEEAVWDWLTILATVLRLSFKLWNNSYNFCSKQQPGAATLHDTSKSFCSSEWQPKPLLTECTQKPALQPEMLQKSIRQTGFNQEIAVINTPT